MSLVFNIKNKKKLFSKQAVLTLGQCMDLVENLTQFSVDESAEDFDPETFYMTPLSDLGVVVMGIYEESGRGFELSYEAQEDAYQVRVNTPATSYDWEVALAFMAALAGKMGQDIVDEHQNRFRPDMIRNYDYRPDIEYGIKLFCRQALGKNGGKSAILFGVYRPLAIDSKIANQLLGAGDMVEAFNQLLVKTQYVDAYPAKQRFYRNKEDGQIMGAYALTQELDTVLPFEPYVEYDKLQVVGDNKVEGWQVSLVAYEDEDDPDSYYVLGMMDYNDFIGKLDKAKYYFLDGNYLVVKGLLKAEMEELLQ